MRLAVVAFTLLALGSRAEDRTTEAGEAAITDPRSECSPYSYAPLVAQREAFPQAWKPASILPNDSEAQERWKTISSSIPNIPPKPVPGSQAASNFKYGGNDPDCWWTYSQCVTPKLPGLPPDIADVPEPSTLGYGFDDGPNCSHNAFYDYLESKNQKATMFFIGSNVFNWPLEAQRALTDGHEICVHTWSHPAMTSLSSSAAFAELYYNPQMQVIKLVVGVTPTCWRPPFGDVDDRIRAIANGLGLQNIIWNNDSDDWKYNTGGVTKQQIDTNYQNLINKATNGGFASSGAIMLTHEINNFTMQEAMDYYERLQSAFEHIVPVAVALNKTQPYLETDYTMPTFEQYIGGTTTSSSDSTADLSTAGPSRVAAPVRSHSPVSNSSINAAFVTMPWSRATQLVAAIIIAWILL